MLLQDALEEYRYHCLAKGFTAKTMKNKQQEYKQLLEFLQNRRGIKELESITYHDLKSYIRQKQVAGLQPQSIVTMAKQIKAFFQWCVSEQYIIENPMQKVTLPKLPKKILTGFTTDEVKRMMSVFSSKDYIEVRNKAIIAMMSDCGLRSMEIQNLKPTDIKDTTLLVNGKGQKERVVFISPVLKKILIKYDRIKKQYFKDKLQYDNNYFLNYRGKQLSHVGIYNLTLEAGKRAGVDNVHPHKFRHFYSVQALRSGIDIYSLSRLLGHSDISTTQRYLQSLNIEELSDKANASSPLMNLNKGDN